MWRHIYCNMSSYLLQYVIIYWNITSYLLECGIILIEICCHIYWNMVTYLLEYAVIFITICHHIYLLLYSNSDKNYIQNITSVKLLGGIPPNNSKNIDI